MGTEELLRHRMLKFRKIGGFQEGLPVDPERKVNMKRKEEPRPGLISDKALQGEVNKLKQQIMKAKETSSIAPDMDQNGLIEKLQREINYEFSEAAKALGIEDKLSKMREEFAKAENAGVLDQYKLSSFQYWMMVCRDMTISTKLWSGCLHSNGLPTSS